ncbi:MAG: T9SS type A sorting domain-containing protein [Candidatus Delongbacteria bacterium]|nr:T9SS type A sorting domain-containing protein [Candidatus Delongbacteria bacterium]MBN2836773.1 T9SS type A sorting domain-containing protein [Candidatus Delongbacteria bacterium]
MSLNFKIVIILIIVYLCNAQIILENDYSEGRLYASFLKYSGLKYYTNQGSYIKIYNSDHSLLRTISVSTSINFEINSLSYLSENLFNTSINMALAVNLISTANGIEYKTLILDENGSVLVELNDCIYVNVVDSQDGPKMVAWFYNNGSYSSKVYDLPGEVVSELELVNNVPELENRAYPNPSNGTVLIDYELPPNVENAVITIFNIYGEEVKKILVDKSFNSIALNTEKMTSGTYKYSITSNNQILGQNKFVVVK